MEHPVLQDVGRQAIERERQLAGVTRSGGGWLDFPTRPVQEHSAAWHSCALSWLCVLVLPTTGLGPWSLTKERVQELKVLMKGHDGH